VKLTNFPSTLSEYYYYDADNNPTSKTDRKGQTITYVYNALNRLSVLASIPEQGEARSAKCPSFVSASFCFCTYISTTMRTG